MSARLLLTGGDEIGVLGALRGLHDAGHTIWVQARSERSYAGRSRAAAGTIETPDPRVDPDGFASTLAAAVERLRIDAVLPGTEAGLVALAPHKRSFAAGVSVGVPDADIVERATSKEVLAELAARVGLAMPPTTRLDAGSARERRRVRARAARRRQAAPLGHAASGRRSPPRHADARAHRCRASGSALSLGGRRGPDSAFPSR